MASVLTAGQAISNVLVLRAAWTRTNSWYVGGGLAPEPELSRWRLHPEAELRKLSRELLEGTWEPQLWSQVPYPKKNRSLRHYVLPTVRDQVAFMAHLVLLGPLFDKQVHSFAFGNRWYRPMQWNRRRPIPKWEERPYPFATSRIYLPYSRSHGLFRRAAHWTVAQMTKTPVREQDYAGRVQHFDDYEGDSLPPWTRREWWGGSGGERAYWAALDIQMAYPSVLLGRLRLAMDWMLDDACPHPPIRRREGAMARFRDIETLQKFAAARASIHNHFSHQRRLNRRETFTQHRADALTEWGQLAA